MGYFKCMAKATYTILCLLFLTFNTSYADDEGYDDSQMSESHEEMPHPAMPIDEPPPPEHDVPVDEPVYDSE